MAEVSGTNIRELESFCERCAGEAGDREREGGELTFDDIDAIASQYFDTSAKKINVQTVQSVIEEQYGVTHESSSARVATPISPKHAISLSTWPSKCAR